MKNVTKQDLVQEAAKSSGHPQLEIKEVAEQFMRLVGEYLTQEKTIEIRGFGSFALSFRPPRVGRNPKSGDKVSVPEKWVPHFKAGKELRERVDDAPKAG